MYLGEWQADRDGLEFAAVMNLQNVDRDRGGSSGDEVERIEVD